MTYPSPLPKENLAARYSLDWDPATTAIIITIAENLLPALSQLTAKSRIIRRFRDEFHLADFQGDPEKEHWGYKKTLTRVENSGDYARFALPLTAIREENSTCRACSGTGQTALGKCSRCAGSGRSYQIEWLAAYAQSATLTLLFAGLNDNSFPNGQPLFVNPATLFKRGCPLSGRYNPDLVKKMAAEFQGPGSRISEMETAMKAAHSQMFGKITSLDEYRFTAEIHTAAGWLNLSCPGDACGLNPSSGAEYKMETGQGYSFDSHNVDTPMQQLTLLAGLAALSTWYYL